MVIKIPRVKYSGNTVSLLLKKDKNSSNRSYVIIYSNENIHTTSTIINNKYTLDSLPNFIQNEYEIKEKVMDIKHVGH